MGSALRVEARLERTCAFWRVLATRRESASARDPASVPRDQRDPAAPAAPDFLPASGHRAVMQTNQGNPPTDPGTRSRVPKDL